MNITEVARQAQVSTATVSRALNGVRTVDPVLVRRVRRAAAELGYFPNKQARALVKGTSRILGIIVPEITNPFFPAVVQSFEDVAVAHDYEVLLTSTISDPARIEGSVRRMIERRVDGVAVLTFGLEDLLLQHLSQCKVPLVFVDVTPPISGASTIRIDYMRGIRQAVQHLAALRHERIAFVTGPLQLKSAAARKFCFEEAMGELGLGTTAAMTVASDHSIEGGTQALRALLDLPRRPTAVICSNDVTAMGVIRAAYGRISIPSQLSLIGFDDIHLSSFTTPPLTTIRMSQAELARLAFNALVEGLEAKSVDREPREYWLNTELVLRETTARAPV